MRWTDLAWFVPLAVSISLVMGASGRRDPNEIFHVATRTFKTLVVVVGGVALSIKLLILFFV